MFNHSLQIQDIFGDDDQDMPASSQATWHKFNVHAFACSNPVGRFLFFPRGFLRRYMISVVMMLMMIWLLLVRQFGTNFICMHTPAVNQWTTSVVPKGLPSQEQDTFGDGEDDMVAPSQAT